MKESSVERKLVTAITKLGGWAPKFTSPGTVGVPDRLVILPGGQIIFVELKTDVGRLSPRQVLVHQRLEELGCSVWTLYGAKGVEEFIDAIQTMGIPKGG